MRSVRIPTIAVDLGDVPLLLLRHANRKRHQKRNAG